MSGASRPEDAPNDFPCPRCGNAHLYEHCAQLTVSALIELLRAFPADAVIEMEGCDCLGDAGTVVPRKGGTVLIRRTRHQWEEGPDDVDPDPHAGYYP